MQAWESWVLTGGVAVAMLLLMRWILVFLALRGTRLAAPPDDAHPVAADAPWQPFEAAAIAELEGWGFECRHVGIDAFGWESARVLFFAHRDLPHFARLQMRANAAIGLPVMFVSFGEDGAPISTINRLAWLAIGSVDSLATVDARVDSTEAQWSLHRERAMQARAVDAEVAQARVEAAIRNDRAESLAQGLWVRGSHYVRFSSASAWRVTRALQRERALVNRPLVSAATTGDSVPTFLASMLDRSARVDPRLRTERGLKLALLLASLGVAWAAWSLAFDWKFAASLIAVVLVHEFGHAIAMRAFGWTNLHVFFLPLMGAVATGGRPRAQAAWKDAVMLFAGPVPGLLVGLVLLRSPLVADPTWHATALIAVSINAFNLLPLGSLDGGQLLSIALLNRWPAARLVFNVLSAVGLAAVGWKLESPVAFLLALVMIRGWRTQTRLAAIERRLERGPGATASTLQVCEAVCAQAPTQSLLQHAQLAQLASRRRQVPRAGVVTSVGIVAVLAGLWLLSAEPLATMLSQAFGKHHAARQDRRTPAQKTFDTHWSDRASPAERLARVTDDATHLDVADGRQRDVAWLRTQSLPTAERRPAIVERLYGANAVHLTRRRVVHAEVYRTIDEAADVPSAMRLDEMRSLASWMDSLAAGVADFEDQLEVRLRVAEAQDLDGDEAGARRSLDEVTGFVAARDTCRCNMATVLRARAWFESAHGRPLAAIRLLDGAVARATPGGADALADVRASAFQQAGDGDGGLEMMRKALQADTLDAAFRPLPADPKNEDRADFVSDDAPELALAYHLAHRDAQARQVCAAWSDECRWAATREVGATVPDGAWQARHVRERVAYVRGLVDPASAASAAQP